ncbi:MAG: hypothetical protein NT091_02240, partial [Candidatus Falkowbacteria bacterium]|nr:hypothetical protein [Candidatus Falkowbacteria bacterium]
MKLLSHVLSPSNNAKNWRLFIFILIVATASLATNLDKQYNHYAEIVGKKIGINIPKVPQKDFKLGLDLLGGSSLIYRANTDNIPAADQK